ncbi:MAG: radical SAM protein [Oscillospiraceae bacterium]|nr:radical SAM protein [Oscillospiraceae bacterium]
MDYIPAKTIVTKTKHASAWFGADYTMNIYRGCCHGCIYCDSRSLCYRIDNFDRVRAKENALQIIRDDLNRKVQKGVVATGAMSDPYNPFEQTQSLTRHALELLFAYEFGVAVATKSPLITRDIDVLQDIQTQAPVLVKLTITTADDALSKQIEPHVVPSSDRFRALRALSDKGIYAGVLLMPVLPWITDTEENILNIVRLAHDNGAKYIYPAFGVTLRAGQREYFYQQLAKQFPGLREQYAKRFGDRYSCASPHAKQLHERFAEECQKRGLRYKMPSITEDYKRPYKPPQITFF